MNLFSFRKKIKIKRTIRYQKFDSMVSYPTRPHNLSRSINSQGTSSSHLTIKSLIEPLIWSSIFTRMLSSPVLDQSVQDITPTLIWPHLYMMRFVPRIVDPMNQILNYPKKKPLKINFTWQLTVTWLIFNNINKKILHI